MRFAVQPIALFVAVSMVACGSDEPTDGNSTTAEVTGSDATSADVVCNCPADDACSTQRCLPTGKCEKVPRPDGTPCSDGDVCSVGDLCSEGKCSAGKHSMCACKESDDCADDGNLCNGSLFCDKKVLPWVCRTKPGTVVVCEGGGGSVSATGCATSACDAKTGKCVFKHQNTGLSCDDGDKCTVDETCTGGKCAGSNVCVCKTTSDCAAQDDGNPCNGALFCDTKAGKCVVNPASVIKCSSNDDTDCLASTCSKTTGICQLTARPTSTKCDDDDKCTSGDHCSGGQCVPGNVTCACKTNKDCLAFDDGDKCNGIPICDKTSGTCKPNPATIVSCASVNDTTCLHNVCLPAEGTCTMKPRKDVKVACETKKDAAGKPYEACAWQVKKPGDPADKGPFACSDGDVCTTGETCDGGTCKPSATTCKCKSNADCAGNDDGNLCNGTFYCDKSLKVADCVFNPASKVFCSKKDDTACLKSRCDKKTGVCGLQAVNLGKACNDGKVCTVATVCQGDGACAGGKANPCDDKKLCTVDSCHPTNGCVNKPRACSDGNACTVDACDAKTGQCTNKSKADNTVCDADGSGCTVGDGCQKGACKAGAKVTCVDKTGPCQATICQSTGATSHECVVANRKDGASCPDDKGSCLIGAKCSAGQCKPGTAPRLRQHLVDLGKGKSVFHDVVALSNGGAFVVGSATLSKDTKVTASKMFYTRFDRMLQRDRTQSGPASEASVHTAAQRVFADADGSIWVLGTSKTAKGIVLTMRRLDLELKTQNTWHIDPTPDDDRLTAATRGLGGFFLAGARMAQTGIKGYSLVRIGEDGKIVWHKSVNDANTQLHAMAMTVAGKLFTAGAGYVKGEPTEELWRLWTPTNGELFDDLVDANGDVRAPVAVIPTFGDEVEVLQRVRTVGKTRTLFSWLDGKLAYARRVQSTTVGNVPRAMIRTKSGDSVLVGHTSTTDVNAAKKRDAWIRIADRYSNTVQEHVFGSSDDEHLNAVAEANDGLLLLAGTRTVNGLARGWLLRTGPWGNRTCLTAGLCWKTQRASCNDGKSCTRDRCDPKSGCKPLPHNDGSYCSPPFKCALSPSCVSGKCEPGVNGKLHVNTIDDGTDATLMLTKRADGTLSAWRFTKTKELQLWDVSKLGMTTAPYEAKLCTKLQSASAATMLTTGDALIAGLQVVSGAKRAAFCYADLDSDTDDWKTAWTRFVGPPSDCPKCVMKAVGVAETVDNSVYTLAGYSGAKSRAVVTRLTPAGVKKWTQTLQDGANKLTVNAIIANQDGAPVIGGQTVTKSAGLAWLARLNVLGNKVWAKTYQNTVKISRATIDVVIEGKYRGYIAAGIASPNSLVHMTRVMAVDGNGNQLWRWTPGKVDMSRPRALLLGPDAAVTVAGDVQIAGKWRMQVRAIAGTKLVVDRVNMTAEAQLAPAVAMRLADGGAFFGARVRDEDGDWSPGFARSGPWGFSTCAGAQSCHPIVAAKCDDKNPCTVDYCEPGAGCKHAAINGVQCGTERFCNAGKCLKKP